LAGKNRRVGIFLPALRWKKPENRLNFKANRIKKRTFFTLKTAQPGQVSGFFFVFF
jgi:hypothetical protein